MLAGQTKRYTLSVNANSVQSDLPTYVEFGAVDDFVKPAHHDPNHEDFRGTLAGRPDGYVASAFVWMDSAAAPVTEPAMCEGGYILDCPINGQVSQAIKSRYTNNAVSPVSIVTQPPVGGSVTVDVNNVITFIATPAYTGTTYFQYTCTDGDTRRSWVKVT